jgi:hypothetical protein
MQNNLFIVGETPKGSCIALPVKAGGELSSGILSAIALANESFTQATARLIRLADLAYGQRDYESLGAIASALQSIPFKPAQNAATYYQAVLLNRAGDLDAAASLLADLHAPRALLTLGTIREQQGSIDEAARLHLEAMRASRGVDLFAFVGASIGLATVRSIEGDHAASLHGFQSLAPVIRIAAQLYPALYSIWHNSLAVELCELGYRDEARAAVAVALASPIAHAYQEFEATAAELRQSERVTVAVSGNDAQIEQGSDAAPYLVTVTSEPLPCSPFTDTPIRCALNIRAGPRAPPSMS